MNGDQLLTWDALGTFAGASALTYIVVAFTKRLVDQGIPWLPTPLYAVVVSFIILLLAQLATGADPLDWRIYLLALANGFYVAATAGQMHDKALNPPTPKTKGASTDA